MTNVVEIGRVVVNGTPKIAAREVDAAGNPGAVLVSWNVVDDSIGASYCRISMNDECMLKAELLDKSGYLWINQREYVCKNGITRDDQIYFGEKKIKLEVSKFIGAVWGYDISHLKDVWDKYKETQEKLRKKDILMKKLRLAAKDLGIKEVAVAGGVSANTGLRNAFLDHARRYRWNVYIPKFGYTTDNAAMIAITGYYKYMDGDFCSIDKPAYSRVSIG
jgi:hypothetical protein